MSGAHGSDRNGDGTLLAAFKAGHGDAFEEIVRRHYPGLLRVAEQRCGSGALAEDAVQAALVRAHRYLKGDGAVENLGAWLRRIVHNCSTDLVTRRSKSPHSLDVDVAAPEDTTLERGELRAIVADAIERLPAIYREPLRMRYLHGLEAREVAAQLNDNLHSIKSRIARGRRELRRRLEPVLARAGYLT